MPELELGQPSNEWPELLVILLRESGLAILQIVAFRERGVEFRL